ncbi:nose resistant to fluoxetine protein 6 [Trichonephila clavipes]|nr:nose resistant to fluoxetine protein 6 [Trichonephila clavipes]
MGGDTLMRMLEFVPIIPVYQSFPADSRVVIPPPPLALRSGRTSVESDHCSKRPLTTQNAAVFEKVENLTMKDRRLTVRETAELVEISTGSPHAILRDHAWSLRFDTMTKPYTRMDPYLVGIALAYYLFKRKQNNSGKLSLVKLSIGWVVASVVTLTTVFGIYHQEPDVVTTSFYTAVNRSCYACGLAWVIFVCVIGQGGFVNSFLSWKFWIPLSRLTFCAYLVHPLIQTTYFASLRDSIVCSHITMVMYHFGFLIMSYMAALVVSLLFESPVIRLERLIRNKFTS